MLWAPFMYRDEAAMLECRAEAFAGRDVTHVACESPWTHRGVPKPLSFARDADGLAARYPGARWRHVTDGFEPDPDPWVAEHHQRNSAWKVIAAEAAPGDVVLIADVDEIPSPALLDFLPRWAAAGPLSPLAVRMRTFLFAADWECADPGVPPACVAATVRQLRDRAGCGEYLAEVRDGRCGYPEFPGFGGWHFSWLGGPARQRDKLLYATCHREILRTREGELILSGARWRSAEDGGGLPVRPVDVDETWPAYVRERRCPPEWFRPRGGGEGAAP